MVVENKKTGYTQTELGEIPSDWIFTKFGEVISDFSAGQTPSRTKPEYFKGSIPWITSGELNYNLIADTKEKITAEAARSANLKLIPKGTFLFAITGLEAEGTRGSCAITGINATTNQSTMALFPKKDCLTTEYLFYFYVAYGKRLALTYCQGTKQQSYTAGTSKFLPIIIPPTIEEQNRIAQVLSDTDHLIKSLDRLIEKKKNIKQGAMQELLTGKKRLPGFKGELEIKRLDEISTIFRGASPRPIEDQKWFDENSDIGWVRISDVTKSNKYLFDTTQSLSESGVKNSRFVSPNNLIMSICATVGRPIITRKKICIHDGFVVFEKPQVNVEYLYYYLASIEKMWSRHGQTGSQMNLNIAIIGNEKVMLPPTKEEQSAIGQVLSDMDSEIETLGQKRDKYRQLKVGIMQQLLTGRIRLKCKN